ncbi:hypothetical protein BwSH14_03330 [Bradyrhizobium ottawaense]|nr:hypothetical protein BwSH14_03330 [Bradyrhizobium ottawaense]GMO70915.1 hypothetical protein BwSH17_28250 [Bradyrhizobium ottawaense]
MVPVQSISCAPQIQHFTNHWVMALSLASLIGVGAMIYELAIVRGYGFSTPVFDLRTMQVEQADAGFVGSWLGGFGRLFVSAIVAAWIVACLRWQALSWRGLVVLLVSTLAVFLYQAAFEGGRSFATALVLVVFFASAGSSIADVSHDGRLRLSSLRFRHAAPLVLAFVVLLANNQYNLTVFASRGSRTIQTIEQQLDQTLSATASTHETADDKAPKAEQLEIIDQARASSAPPYALAYLRYASDFDIDLSSIRDLDQLAVKYSRAMNWLYITQGANEFDRIFGLSNLSHSYGFYQFPQIAQILSKLLGKDMRYNLARNLPNVGTYITLMGAFYLDFGTVPSLILAALMGLGLRYGLQCMFDGATTIFSLSAPLILVIMAAAPVTTLLPNMWPCFLWMALMCASPLFMAGSRRRESV